MTLPFGPAKGGVVPPVFARLQAAAAAAGPPTNSKSVSSATQPCPLKRVELAEVIEVVTRGATEGSVVGPGKESTEPSKKKIVERQSKAGSNYKQYINLDKDIEGSAKRNPEYGRFVELRARIKWTTAGKTDSLAGREVTWKLLQIDPKHAKRPAQPAAPNLPGAWVQGLDSPGGAVKTVSSTDSGGWTPVVKVYLSEFAGDVFKVTAQADEDDKGSPSGKVLSVGNYQVWRKFWYQVTKAAGFNPPQPAKSEAAYAKTCAEMNLARTETFEPAAHPDRTFYPKWMTQGGSSDDPVAIIGEHNKTDFYTKLVNDPAMPVLGHLILCEHQWDPKGESSLLTIDPLPSNPYDVAIPDKGVKVLDKPLAGGGLVVDGKWLAKNRSGRLIAQGNLTDQDVKVRKGRATSKTVTVSLPASAPAPTRDTKVIIKLKVRVNKSYLGESNGKQMLIVYDSNDPDDFHKTVTHEFGHGFHQTPEAGIQPAGLQDHPEQVSGDGDYNGTGPHCRHGASPVAVSPNIVEYEHGTCVMFHSYDTSVQQDFCDVCQPYVRMEQMTSLS